MKYKRWILFGVVVALAAFSFYHLSTSGTAYHTSTTSDSGYFEGISREIDREDGMVDHFHLPTPPHGEDLDARHQFQPLVVTTLYRSLNAINSNITIEDVMTYFSPFIFSLTVIGAFLAAKELGGNVAGIASAVLFTTMAGSIYWVKIGAMDRRTMQIFFGVWLIYGFLRVLNSEGSDMIKNLTFTGILYSMFLLTWPGASYVGAIFAATLFLIITEKAIEGLGFTITGIGLLILGSQLGPFGMIDLIGLFTFLAGVVRLARDRESIEYFEKEIYNSITERVNFQILGAVLGVLGISALIAISFGEGWDPDIWSNLFIDRIGGFIGIGANGNGVSFPTFATEMQAESNELASYFSSVIDGNTYRNMALTGVTAFFVILAAGKTFLSAKRTHLYILSWALITMPMVLEQARFGRTLWNWWPIMAGFGFGVLFTRVKDWVLSSDFSLSDWMGRLRNPLLMVVILLLLVAPFVHNARAEQNASEYYPPPHGGSLMGDFYTSLHDSYAWMSENTPEDSILGVRWSYGHFATGVAQRSTVTDGAQDTGWANEWRDGGTVPPDYIRDIRGDEGIYYGVNAESSRFEVNGRRPDIRDMTLTGDEDYFRWLINTYREEFEIPINYLVINERDRRDALMGKMGLLGTYYDIDIETPVDIAEDGMTFYFEDKEVSIREQVIGDDLVVETGEGEQLMGYGIYGEPFTVTYQPEVVPYLEDAYSMTDDYDIEKFLSLVPAEAVGMQGDQLVGLLTDLNGVPMPIRAFEEDFDLPEYADVAHREDYTVVLEIDHEEAAEGMIPDLEEPVDNAKLNENNPDFEWSDVGGAESYEIEIDNNPDFSDPLIMEEVQDESFSIPEEDSLGDGQYYWRVRAIDSGGVTRSWSSTESFVVDTVPPLSPDLVSPKDSDVVENEVVLFEWDASDNYEEANVVSGVSDFTLQIDNSPDFSSPILEESEILEEIYEMDMGDEEIGEYWWRVKAFDSAGNESQWSENIRFNFEPN